jgi:23S rRNA (adenine2503-C2)-methyltransferase
LSKVTVNEQISVFDLAGIETLRRELRIDPQWLRRFRNDLLKHGRSDADALDELPAPVRDEFTRRVELHALELDSRHESAHDGATKLIFRGAGGVMLESVILRIATGRTTACLSSQAGCAAECDFCATGRMGLARNLTTAEILDQLVQARQLAAAEGRTIRNLVFMGMGEPFHNARAVDKSLAALVAPELFHHPPSRILVSTVGLPLALVGAARRYPEVHFALSLHSARQEVRERIMPLARRYPLDSLRRAVAELNRLQPPKTQVMIEYLMLAGVNDSADDARALAEWLAGLRVHVNLIPYNPVPDAPHLAGSDRPTREAFGAILKAAGFKTTIRHSLGADVAAACGQLVQRENRQHVSAQAAGFSQRS